MALDFDQGVRLVRIARAAIVARFLGDKLDTEAGWGLDTSSSGVFCTLSSFPSGELRGCMGRLGLGLLLDEAVAHVAVQAAQDPRFPPLRAEEMPAAVVEVSVLSALERVPVRKGERFPESIAPGFDGLTLRLGPHFGLLLPQVWDGFDDPLEFMAALSHKAGLPGRDAWRDPQAVIHRFRAQVFCEKTPAGDVREDAGPWLPPHRQPRSA